MSLNKFSAHDLLKTEGYCTDSVTKQMHEVYFLPNSSSYTKYGSYVTGYFDYDAKEIIEVYSDKSTFDFSAPMKFAANASANKGALNVENSFARILFYDNEVMAIK